VNVGTRGLPGEDDTPTATAPDLGIDVDVDLDDLDFLAALDGLPAE
jgi:hypothetical protein